MSNNTSTTVTTATTSTPSHPPATSIISETGAIISLAVGIATLVGILLSLQWKLMNVVRDVIELKHDAKNQDQKINSLDDQRDKHEIRIVRLEETQSSIMRGIERIEHRQEKQDEKMEARFEMLGESIREIRDVGPRKA